MSSSLFGAAIVFAAFGQGVTVKTSVPTESERKEAWTRALNAAATPDVGAIVFDVNLSADAPDLSKTRLAGAERMRLLQRLTRRTWRQKSGVQVFTRAWRPGAPPLPGETERGLAWLKELRPEEVRALAGDGVSFGDLSEAGKSFVADLVTTIRPNMATQLADDPANVTITLAFAPAVMVRDPKTGSTKSLSIFTKLNSPMSGGLPERPRKPATAPVSAPLEKPEPGPLRYDEGKIVTLRQLCEDATAAFKELYVYDGRLASSTYYVKGSFTAQALREALRIVADPPPPEALDLRWLDPQKTLAELIKGPLAGLLDQEIWASGDPNADPRKFTGQNEADVADLTKTFPKMEGYFAANGVRPGMLARLGFGILIGVNAPGISPLPNAQGTIGGRPVPVLARNAFQFQIGP